MLDRSVSINQLPPANTYSAKQLHYKMFIFCLAFKRNTMSVPSIIDTDPVSHRAIKLVLQMHPKDFQSKLLHRMGWLARLVMKRASYYDNSHSVKMYIGTLVLNAIIGMATIKVQTWQYCKCIMC